MSDDLIYAIALKQVPNIGDITARKLIAYFDGIKNIFKGHKEQFERIPGIGAVNAENLRKFIQSDELLKKAENEIAFLNKYGIKAYYFLDTDYPRRLNNCDDSPIAFFAKGDIDFNRQKIISIVGTRKATSYGKDLCRTLVQDLAHHSDDMIIVSGLAFGIDITAHKAAMDASIPTIAVLAHGLDTIYPAQHRTYAKNIATGKGALVSDFLSGKGPERTNFVKRNRIIAGLSDATIVVESSEVGGALITADIANSYNRDVFAIPGRVTDMYSTGTNFLIKSNKAALIESAKDLELFMGWQVSESKQNIQKELFLDLNDSEKLAIKIIDQEKEIPIDLLSNIMNLPVSQVSALLLTLEFKGLIRSLPGKVYTMAMKIPLNY